MVIKHWLLHEMAYWVNLKRPITAEAYGVRVSKKLAI